MAKRQRIANDDHDFDEVPKDTIQKLPDDVLVSIISLLKLKEAARTSVLSRRWRYISLDII